MILAVDGVSLDGQTVDGARERIRGPKGTVVTLTVAAGGDEPFALEITRDVIEQEEVESRTLGGGTVGYVRLNGFSDRGADELEEAIEAHLDADRTKLILDLRGNPGGYVTAARAVASEFIGSGPVFWEQDAKGVQVETDGVARRRGDESAHRGRRVSSTAAARRPARSSPGALQDTGRATIVGQTTFGKGTVQQWQELAGESGAFRLTVARWLTPDKRWIHDVGLEPDVVVTIPDDVAAERIRRSTRPSRCWARRRRGCRGASRRPDPAVRGGGSWKYREP